MNLPEFSQLNLERSNGPFNCENQSPLYWSNAIAEEAGEVAGIIKKLTRGFNHREHKKTLDLINERYNIPGTTLPILDDEAVESYWRATLINQLKYELADIFTYVDIAYSRLCSGTLGQAVQDKFNLVSSEMGCLADYKMITPIQ